MLIHIFNSFDKCLSLYDKEGNKFRLIGFARTEFGEVHVLSQQFCFQFLQIHDFGYRYNGKAAKVGVEDKGLRVCIADDSYSGISLELVQFIFKLRAEIGAFQIVDGTGKLRRFCIYVANPPRFVPKCEL